ncbi:MAG: NYN domain-containing protein [Scytonematopsis contorta HA4267-MV1]|jgi:uncharacterized LabA/DUF88 family protein|nr:NYN domain-containing protein [Scytonematopsis contorta HA4267-MV1]
MNVTSFPNKPNQYDKFNKKVLHQNNTYMDTGVEYTEITTLNKPSNNIFKCDHRGRLAIFIDGANLFYAAMQLGIDIDYSKLLRCLTPNSQLLRAFFYTGFDSASEKQQGFLLWMRRNGYRVITKDLILFADGSKKANLHVEMAVDMITLASHYDTAVLVSGDGELAYAANTVAYKGARLEIVSLRSMTSHSLIDVADCFVDLEDIKEEIQQIH